MDQQVLILAVIALVVVVFFAAYFVLHSGNGNTQAVATTQQTAPAATAEPTTTVQGSGANTSGLHVTNTLPYTVKLANNGLVGGFYLVNQSGFTLYLTSLDTPGSGASSCYGQCAYYWQAFYAANLSIPSNLSASKFGVITRTNGAKQLTYYGYPIYHYIPDNAPNQLKGQGVAGAWFVLTYPNLTT